MYMWLVSAFLNPIFLAISDIIDSYSVSKLFKSKSSLIFYTSLINLILLFPLFGFLGLPTFPSAYTMMIFVGLALIYVLYLFPYYKALEKADTSSVVAMFAVGQVFVPILAYFIVGEILSWLQYVGMFLIIIASVLLNLQPGEKFKLSSSLWWMVLCTFILAFEYVLYKLAFNSVDWITGFSWPVVFSFIFASFLFLISSARRSIGLDISTQSIKKFSILTVGQLASFFGIALGTYAVSIAPVTVVRSVMASEPAIVLLIAALFGGMFPNVFSEKTDQSSLFRKITLFIIIGIGLTLAIGPEI